MTNSFERHSWRRKATLGTFPFPLNAEAEAIGPEIVPVRAQADVERQLVAVTNNPIHKTIDDFKAILVSLGRNDNFLVPDYRLYSILSQQVNPHLFHWDVSRDCFHAYLHFGGGRFIQRNAD